MIDLVRIKSLIDKLESAADDALSGERGTEVSLICMEAREEFERIFKEASK